MAEPWPEPKLPDFRSLCSFQQTCFPLAKTLGAVTAMHSSAHQYLEARFKGPLNPKRGRVIASALHNGLVAETVLKWLLKFWVTVKCGFLISPVHSSNPKCQELSSWQLCSRAEQEGAPPLTPASDEPAVGDLGLKTLSTRRPLCCFQPHCKGGLDLALEELLSSVTTY